LAAAPSRQWIITAYALAFGSLLLLGGKLGDLFGRKWTLITGLVSAVLSPKSCPGAGACTSTLAMFLFTRLTPGSSYPGNVLPGLLILGVGMRCIFAPAFSTATLRVEGSEAGVASAMVNTSQQVGGSVGTSLLSTILAGARRRLHGQSPPQPRPG
jgi:MFS family permease